MTYKNLQNLCSPPPGFLLSHFRFPGVRRGSLWSSSSRSLNESIFLINHLPPLEKSISQLAVSDEYPSPTSRVALVVTVQDCLSEFWNVNKRESFNLFRSFQ